MTSKEYSELLKDGRWIGIKEIVLERDGYRCQWCTQKNMELHVHHTYYKNGLKPWEYPLGSLITLCKKCHWQYHNLGYWPGLERPVRSFKQVLDDWLESRHKKSA